jgi:prepilin-type N-terminal cleavage/methylation domain-containing protein
MNAARTQGATGHGTRAVLRRRPATRCRAGFTLVELLVVIAIIGLLVALLLPAIQAARESGRRMQCGSHLKQLGIALQNYHDTNKSFPSACRSHQTNPGWVWGHTWIVAILPFCEQRPLHDQLDLIGNPHTGLIYQTAGPPAVTYNTYNGKLVAGVPLPFLFCPSSPVDEFVMRGTIVPGPQGAAAPAYTATTGAVDHSTAVNKDSQPNPHRARGIQSCGGVLLPYTFTRLRDVLDGTSMTVILGEQSDWCYDPSGGKHYCRSDYGHSFMMGTTPESYISSEDRWFNTTTVRYGVNHKAWNSTGVGEDYYACNRPIQSAHPGGAYVVLSDGAVRFLNASLALQTFFDLVNRDDGRTPAQF